MNKFLSFSLSLLLSLAFFSCDTVDDVLDEFSPEITFKAKAGFITENTTVTVGDSINFSWEVVAMTSKIESFVIRLNNDDIYSPEDVDKNEYNDEFGIRMKEEGTFTFAFIATDKDDRVTKEEITVTVAPVEVPETPLAAEAAFTWERKGGAPATGLEQFGLTWTENSNNAEAIIKKGAEKFVKLTTAEWTSIESKEQLAKAVEAAEDIADYRGISTNAEADHDIVLATQKGEEYFLIHITKSTIDASDSNIGAVITITGNYKN